jgi:hypothetical protein
MKRVTFYGHEKNETTARLAQINLAVNGLEGKIRAGNEAITYYKDPHELAGQCDFVMANPPFNVDEVDAEKVKGDKRLPFGLPGVNKGKKVSNANYLWLSYFYTYLNENGRAGVVMSSQASSAGRDEASLDYKQRLQALFFPEGIAFDGNRFNRTAATAPIFSYLAPSESADERVVSRVGIEPKFPASSVGPHVRIGLSGPNSTLLIKSSSSRHSSARRS